MSDFWSIKQIRTRKEHRCYICKKKILRGSLCMYESGKFEGEFSSFHLCNKCYELKEHYCAENREHVRCDGWNVQDIIYDMRENSCYNCKKHDICKFNYDDCVKCKNAISLYMKFKKGDNR